MYLSRPTSIDFVAHHEIQFQSCRGVYERLSKIHDCKALIGQDATPSGAEVAVMLDHCVFQPRVNKNYYKYIVHMSHDLADLDVYAAEKHALSTYDLILVPGAAHRQRAEKVLRGIPVYEIGWPKLEAVGVRAESQPPSPSDHLSVIYAPTFIDNREWVALLPALIAGGHHVIIKNHVYYDFESGAAPPKGSEVEYKRAIESLRDMEEFVARNKFPNVEYVDRRANLCTLFPRADALITDASSASLEFLSFGLSIETGRCGPNEADTKPSASLLAKRVRYLPLAELIRVVGSKEAFANMVEAGKRDAREAGNPLIFSPPHGPSTHAASLIDMFLWLRQNGGRVSFDSLGRVMGGLRKWL